MLGKPSRRTRKKLEQHGVRADAVVLEVGKRGMTVTHGNDAIVANTEVIVKLRLRVEPPSEPSFEVATKLRFSQFALPSVGQRLAVVFDPDHHDDLMLDPAGAGGSTAFAPGGVDLGALLGNVQEARAQAGGDREALAELLREQLGANATVIASSAAAAPADPIAQLAQLSDLRDRGALSDEEFEAQKRRILG